METEELLKGLLDWLIIGLREVEAWNEYVDALMRRDEIKEMDPEGLSDEQMAAMSFWRMNGVYVNEEGETRSKFDTELESPDDDEDSAFILSLADWLVKFETDELSEYQTDGSFAELADMCRGIYKIGLDMGDQMSVITVDSEGNRLKSERVARPMFPLSDEQVDEILRKRRGYGARS